MTQRPGHLYGGRFHGDNEAMPRRRVPFALVVALAALAGCSSSDASSAATIDGGTGGDSGGGNPDGSALDGGALGGDGGTPGDAQPGGGNDAQPGGDGGVAGTRGFPTGAPWVSFYGPASGTDLVKTASTFRIINLDADPDAGGFTDAQLTALKAGGQNRVISYMNVGSCEDFRSYWSTDPAGHKSCVNSGALTTPYGGYPNEKWANLGNAAYRDLIVSYVAVRLAARGIDGFFLDNLEVVEHGAAAAEGPCDAACAQGGLDLVWELRQRFPGLLIVMQNATSDVTRLGTTHGVPYPSVLDGISHEEVFSNGGDALAQSELAAWRKMNLIVNGRPFWLASEDYVGACSTAAKPQQQAIAAQAAAAGLSSYVTDASAKQQAPCFWASL
jgi:cysteinyl-tRNA synthetase, unknown class